MLRRLKMGSRTTFRRLCQDDGLTGRNPLKLALMGGTPPRQPAGRRRYENHGPFFLGNGPLVFLVEDEDG